MLVSVLGRQYHMAPSTKALIKNKYLTYIISDGYMQIVFILKCINLLGIKILGTHKEACTIKYDTMQILVKMLLRTFPLYWRFIPLQCTGSSISFRRKADASCETKNSEATTFAIFSSRRSLWTPTIRNSCGFKVSKNCLVS